MLVCLPAGIMNQHSSSRHSEPNSHQQEGGSSRRWDEAPSEPHSQPGSSSSSRPPGGGERWERGVPQPQPDRLSNSLQRTHSTGGGSSSPQVLDGVVQALTVGFANRIAKRMQRHNGYRTMNEAGQLAQIHPTSSTLRADEEGLLPEWLVYHEFVATSRPFLRQVRGLPLMQLQAGDGDHFE